MDAILPAAGKATRMRGIPKFLLPCDENYMTLIEKHIYELKRSVETIFIPVNPIYIKLLESLEILEENIIALPMLTSSMSETILNVLQKSNSSYFNLIMPDTFFHGEMPYNKLSQNPNVAEVGCWKIRNEQKGKLGQVQLNRNHVTEFKDKDPYCSFEYSWGSLTFSRKLVPYISTADPHIGYALEKALKNGEAITAKIINGQYFDCGTPLEYMSLIKTIIK